MNIKIWRGICSGSGKGCYWFDSIGEVKRDVVNLKEMIIEIGGDEFVAIANTKDDINALAEIMWNWWIDQVKLRLYNKQIEILIEANREQ